MDCDLGHPKKLKLVVDLIFEKAVDESKYCRLYALLCRTLNQEVPNYEADPSPCTTFQKSLMNKLQFEFNQRRQGNVEPGSREKRQLLGLSTFIGELYSLSIFTEASVHTCLKTLLTGKDPEALECLVRIMETSGEKLDHQQAKNVMDQYFGRIKKLSENQTLPSRVRFRLLDVIDMRQREWRQRRQIAGPRPVSEIRAEFGSDLDPSLLLLKQPAHAKSENQPIPKRISQTQTLTFFAPRTKESPSQGKGDHPTGPGLRRTTATKPTNGNTSSSNGISNGKTSDGPVPRYEPVRRAAVEVRSPVSKKETKTVAKKAFMPEFIKAPTANHSHNAQNGRFTSLNRPHSQSVPQFQVRRGLPGQTKVNPGQSPFDRINRDRSSHLRKTQSNHQRKESPTHSPIRSQDSSGSSYSRLSPNRRSPVGGLSNGRNSPISRQSPLSPLANDVTEMDNREQELGADEAIELASKLVDRFMDGETKSLSRLGFSSLQRDSQLSVIQYILSTASKSSDDSLAKWLTIVKDWCNRDVTLEAIAKWLSNCEDDGGPGPQTASLISQIAIMNYIDPSSHDFECLFKNGRFHPLFFIIISKLLSAKGIIYIQKHFGNLDLLGMMNNRDRTELRLLLHQHKLLFLRPKYREEHLIEEDKDLEPKEIYRSIKGRCSKDREFGNSAGAMINLVWEDRIDLKKNMPILQKMLVGKIDAQVECLKVLVNAHIERGLPKGALLKQFYDLYHDDVIDEDSFLRWEGDIHDQTPKRAEALKDVERFFIWLRSAEEESDDEKENHETDKKHVNHESTNGTVAANGGQPNGTANGKPNNDETATNGYVNGNSESH